MAEIKVSARLHHSGGSVVGGSLFLASLASNGCFTPVSVSVVTLPSFLFVYLCQIAHYLLFHKEHGNCI